MMGDEIPPDCVDKNDDRFVINNNRVYYLYEYKIENNKVKKKNISYSENRGKQLVELVKNHKKLCICYIPIKFISISDKEIEKITDDLPIIESNQTLDTKINQVEDILPIIQAYVIKFITDGENDNDIFPNYLITNNTKDDLININRLGFVTIDGFPGNKIEDGGIINLIRQCLIGIYPRTKYFDLYNFLLENGHDNIAIIIRDLKSRKILKKHVPTFKFYTDKEITIVVDNVPEHETTIDNFIQKNNLEFFYPFTYNINTDGKTLLDNYISDKDELKKGNYFFDSFQASQKENFLKEHVEFLIIARPLAKEGYFNKLLINGLFNSKQNELTEFKVISDDLANKIRDRRIIIRDSRRNSEIDNLSISKHQNINEAIKQNYDPNNKLPSIDSKLDENFKLGIQINEFILKNNFNLFQPITVYRVTTKNKYKNSQANNSISEPIIMSTSISPQKALIPTQENCCLLKIDLPVGFPWIYIFDIQAKDDEDKIILPFDFFGEEIKYQVSKVSTETIKYRPYNKNFWLYYYKKGIERSDLNNTRKEKLSEQRFEEVNERYIKTPIETQTIKIINIKPLENSNLKALSQTWNIIKHKKSQDKLDEVGLNQLGFKNDLQKLVDNGYDIVQSLEDNTSDELSLSSSFTAYLIKFILDYRNTLPQSN